MANKKIDGSMASSLMEAVEYLAKLEAEISHLRWRVCYYDDPANAFVISSQKARAHCRQIMRALDGVEHRFVYGENNDKTNDEQERTIRSVK